MKIIKGTDAIPVEHPVFLIFGQPGIGKTSLGYSLDHPLLLDFDKGAHRAANRRDTLIIDHWKDVQELMDDAAELEAYRSLTVDTVGRCLDVMTAHIAQTDPKKAPGGNLSLQGWGVLKSNFRGWMAALRAKGKDVLLIAHDKEDKDGDSRIVRPDIAGASFGEVMKVADFVGYLYMANRRRILDFNPTEKWVGKNPAGWEPFELPAVGKCQSFMADLFARGREALGALSEESARVLAQVETWRTKIDGLKTAAEHNAQIPLVTAIESALVKEQARKLLSDHAKAIGLTWQPGAKCYAEPKAEAVA